jgi:hypothetical protein
MNNYFVGLAPQKLDLKRIDSTIPRFHEEGVGLSVGGRVKPINPSTL